MSLKEAVRDRRNLAGRVDHRSMTSEYGVPEGAMESDKTSLTCDYSHLQRNPYRVQTREVVP